MTNLPFHGELMTCCLCGKQHQSDPRVQSDWTLVEFAGERYYVCPNELPLDKPDATKWDFKRAYERILRHIATLRSGGVVH